jgi:hypothetical protein
VERLAVGSGEHEPVLVHDAGGGEGGALGASPVGEHGQCVGVEGDVAACGRMRDRRSGARAALAP